MGTKQEKAIYDSLAELYAELEWEWTLSQAPPGSVSKSERFQKRMGELFRWSQRKETMRATGQKVAGILFAIAVGAGVILLTNEEVRAEVIRFFRKDYGTHTAYQFNEQIKWDGEFELYEPTWVPEGFVEAYRVEDLFFGLRIRYDKIQEEGVREIYFDCMNIQDGGGLSLNTENTKYQKVMYQEEWAEFYESQDEEFLSSFVWQNQNGCYFTLSGKFTLEEFMKIADSMERTEKIKEENKN